MERLIFLDIKNSNTQQVEVRAFSEESANIYIKATTMQEAAELLQQGTEKALEACRDWKPEEEPAKETPKASYRVCPADVNDLQRIIEEYPKGEKGSKFIRSIQKAKAFTEKKDTSGGLRFGELEYLYALTCMDTLSGLKAMYDLAYRRGYNKGKADKK